MKEELQWRDNIQKENKLDMHVFFYWLMKNIFVYIKWNAIAVFSPYAFIKMIPLNDVDFYIGDISYLPDHILQIGLYLKK